MKCFGINNTVVEKTFRERPNVQASNKIRNNANIEQTTAANVATSEIYVVRDVASQEETWKKKIIESESKN